MQIDIGHRETIELNASEELGHILRDIRITYDAILATLRISWPIDGTWIEWVSIPPWWSVFKDASQHQWAPPGDKKSFVLGDGEKLDFAPLIYDYRTKDFVHHSDISVQATASGWLVTRDIYGDEYTMLLIASA